MAVGIRQLTATQQVLATTSGAPSTTPPTEVEPAAVPVTWVCGGDGHELAVALVAAGVLAPDPTTA
jgi:hypothetical protein